MISILIFTFYIINQICFIILYQIWLVFLIFEIKHCLTEVLEQPGGGTPALNVTAICDQRHANVSKQRTLLADAESDQSQRCPLEAKLGPKLPIERTAKTLIRLGGCPG